MSLFGALNAGKTALAVQQAAIQVTGNNIANAGSADYSREIVNTSPSLDQQLRPGLFVGTGVDLDSVTRQVDDSLNARLNSAGSDASAAGTTQQILGQVQSAFGALGTDDISSQMSTFFNDWSTLAGKPTDAGQRQVVVQDGQTLADKFNTVSGQLSSLQSSVDKQITAQASVADGYTTQIAQLNKQIVLAEAGSGGTANSLRDQRDATVKQLSNLLGVKSVEQPNGSINIYAGSQEIVDGANSYGIVAKLTTNSSGNQVPQLISKTSGEPLQISGGQIGGLISSRQQIVSAGTQLDTLAGGLAFELNKLHASGQGTTGYTSTTSTNVVADPDAALDSAAAGLTYPPSNGSFVLHVTQKSSGLSTGTLVKIDLGRPTGDTTLNSLVAQLNAIDGVQATVADGKLTIASSDPSAQTITFSSDNSSTLASLGINTFFDGTRPGT